MTTMIGITNFSQTIQNIKNNLEKNSIAKFYENFVENNQNISKIYIDILNPFFNKRGWYISGELYNDQIISLAKAIKDIDSKRRSGASPDFSLNHVGLTIDSAKKIYITVLILVCKTRKKASDNAPDLRLL